MSAEVLKTVQKSGLRPIKGRERKAISQSLVPQSFAEGVLPCLIKQSTPAVDIHSWLAQNHTLVQEKLIEHGAILFRGFELDSAEKVQRFAEQVMSSIHKQNTEHRPVDDSGIVQVPVEYPSRKFLLWHNENTFNYEWPKKAIFACHTPAQSGGQTPLVDSRIIYQQLAPEIRQQFIEKGVMYVRRYGSENTIGLSWKTIFKTDSKEEVERQCAAQRMEFEWEENDTLVTKARRPAVWQHPISGEWSWINQAQHFHFSCLSDDAQKALLQLHPDGRFPRHCFFGDGSEIPAEVMLNILDLYQQNQVIFDWQKGDLALVDNILAAHARSAYEGERKILVCFGELTSFDSTLESKR
ncbi:TauD/TfdA family dioxygenase [Pseudoalteromonas sp. T1lg65]|uniref:TauD/TfdA family dioxygenase n=1 Tax=Pseudoalteromonas sp. T1lg65 TaxID=2077101 RepID=UPI003F79F9F2